MRTSMTLVAKFFAKTRRMWKPNNIC